MRFLPITAASAAISIFIHSTAALASPLETVVVTASRTAMPLAEVGSSVTVINSDELEDRQAVALSEILRDVPGFAVSRNGVLGSSTQIRVRGAEGNHVMVMIDGVEANDMAQGDEFNFAHLLAGDVDRIEIIRGPQSALWGSDALAGAVNIITRRGAGPAGARGYFEAGSFATLNGGASLSAGTDRYDFHLGGNVLDSDGSNIARSGSEEDGYENASASFTGGIRTSQWAAFTLSARHTDARNEYDETDFVTGLPGDNDGVTDAVQDYAQIRMDLDPFDGGWTNRLTAAFSGTDNENELDGADAGSNEGRRWTFGWQSDVRMHTQAVSDADHVFTLALEHEDEDFRQRGPTDPFAGDPNQDRSARTTSIVGEYRLTYGPALSFSAGARHDINSEFRDDTTWRATAGYALAATGSRLRASYGTGSKNPTFTERFGFFDSPLFPFVGNPDLEPERSRGWEVGVAQRLFNQRLEMDVAYFNESLRREINGFVFDPATFTITAQNTSGVSRRQGVEASVVAELTESLRLSAHYTWLDATQPDGFGGRDRELRRPRHVGGVSVNYAVASGRGNLNVNFLHTGDQPDFFFPPAPPFVIPVRLNSFNLLSVAGAWDITPRVSLFGRIENVLDDDYEEVYGFTSPGLAAHAGIRVSLSPLSLGR